MNNLYTISKGKVKIQTQEDLGSGFFLTFKINNNQFFCLVTNEHVITSNLVQSKEEIIIKYNNEQKELRLKLDEDKRLIRCFMPDYDVTLIEILEDDNIDESYFLYPYIYVCPNDAFINKEIQIIQFPEGNKLSFSEGKITGLMLKPDNYFKHTASTLHGSSGSPIALKGQTKIFAIHKGKIRYSEENAGIFIKNIIEIMQDYNYNKKVNFKKNSNNNSGNSSNSNNSNNSIKDEARRTKATLAHTFHFLGNLLNVNCTRCGHQTKNHEEIEDREDAWECKDCPQDDNICKIK